MAVYLSTFTGVEIDNGIVKANTAAQASRDVDGKVTAILNDDNSDSAVAFFNKVNVFSKAQRNQIVALTPTSNTYTPDFNAGNFFSFTPTANFTLANPTNLPTTGITQSGSFFITQDATGSRTITFGSQYYAAGGISTITLSTTANARDRVDYVIGAAGNIQISIAKDIKA